MEDPRITDPWIWPPAKSEYRYEEPDCWEAIEDFNGAAIFLDSIEQQVKTMLAERNSAALACAVAVANDYVRRTYFRSGIVDALANDDDLEDTKEIGAAQAANERFQETERRMDALLQTREESLRRWPPEDENPTSILCKRAALVANAAVALHKAQRAKDETLPMERRIACITSAWANRTNLENNDRWDRLNLQQASEIQTAYEEIVTATQDLYEHTPTSISPAAKKALDDSDASSLVYRIGEECGEPKAVYDIGETPDGTWDPDRPWAMAYEYQAGLYLKLVNEPYHHPMTRETAMGHATDMLDTMEYLAEERPQEETDEIGGQVMEQATLAMQLAQAFLHDTKPKDVRFLLEEIWEGTKSPEAVQKVTNSLTKGMTLAAIHLTGGGKDQPLHQMLAEIAEAQARNPDEDHVTEMCRARGIRTSLMLPHREKTRTPAPWYVLTNMLHTVYDITTTPETTAIAVVQTLGWDPDHPDVKKEMHNIQQYRDGYHMQ